MVPGGGQTHTGKTRIHGDQIKEYLNIEKMLERIERPMENYCLSFDFTVALKLSFKEKERGGS